MKGQNNGIKVGVYKMLKSERLRFTDFKTLG